MSDDEHKFSCTHTHTHIYIYKCINCSDIQNIFRAQHTNIHPIDL